MKKEHLISLFKRAVDHNASDLHLRSGDVPKYRINGNLTQFDSADTLSKDAMNEILDTLDISQPLKDQFKQETQVDFAFTIADVGRFRANVFRDINGTAAVFRALPETIPTLAELALPAVIKELAELDKGLVLVTGATGSGKSTTLAAMVNHINETTHKHILTIEDPAEFIHVSKHATITQREIGTSALSFSDALVGGMRQDPDVILVGEMRDLESVSNAIKAAETGHLVLATLHANAAKDTVNRLIDIFPEGEQPLIRTMLAESLEGVVSQRLLPRADGQGRTVAMEILRTNHSVKTHIRDGKIEQITNDIQTGVKSGMVSMEDSVKDLVDRGLVAEASIPPTLRPKY